MCLTARLARHCSDIELELEKKKGCDSRQTRVEAKRDTPTRPRLPRETPRGAARRRGKNRVSFTAGCIGLIDLGPSGRPPRNSGLCTATARPAMNVPLTVRTGEMLRCPGNNLRRHCSRTHRHASPHHRVTPFEWSLSLDMSQRRDNQMTDDRSAVGPCSACLPRPRSPRSQAAGPSWKQTYSPRANRQITAA